MKAWYIQKYVKNGLVLLQSYVLRKLVSFSVCADRSSEEVFSGSCFKSPEILVFEFLLEFSKNDRDYTS